MSDNPYQSPAITDPANDDRVNGAANPLPPVTPRQIAVSWMRWIGICAVSAIPSFILGLQVTRNCDYRIPAMVGGIVLFGTAYTFVELFLLRRWTNGNKDLFWSLCIGYGIRITASICFPVGAYLDMFPGILSSTLFSPLIQADNPFTQVAGIVSTTLLQGLLMNLILAGLIAFVYGMFLVARSDLFEQSRSGG